MRGKRIFRHRRHDVLRPLGLEARPRASFWRALAWSLGIILAPVVAMGAYQPAALLSINNLSDIGNAATAWTNLGGGTAGKKAASDNTKANVASVSGSTSVGHIATFADTAGTVQDGGAAAAAPSISKFTGALPTTLSSTNNVTTVSSMGTPAAGIYNLPSPSNGWRGCIKDGATNFNSNTATVKGPSGSIYASAGATAASTGITMTQQGQELCFLSDGTDYYVE